MIRYFFGAALAVGLYLNVAGEATSTTKPSMVGEFVWNELATTDVQAAKDFYGKMFGWEFIDKNAGEMTYTIVKKGNDEFGGIWTIPAAQAGQIPPHWLPYILVENVEQALAKAQPLGATVIKPVQQAGDMGSFAVLKDPTGAHIALWQSAKK